MILRTDYKVVWYDLLFSNKEGKMKHLISVFIYFPPLHRTKQKIGLPELWCPLLLKVCISWKDKVAMYRIKAAGRGGGGNGLYFLGAQRGSRVDNNLYQRRDAPR